MNWSLYIDGFIVITILATATWLLSIYIKDVSIVDSAWSLMFLVASVVYLFGSTVIDNRSLLIIIMISIWATRLFLHLTWRNWGEPEDRRYQLIRQKYSPNFAIKSLGIIFIFQAVLAWIISLPIFAAFNVSENFITLDILAILLWLTCMSFETHADWQ